MSENIVLIIAGVVLFLVGLAKLGSSHMGGFNLSNFGITIGGKNTQIIRTGNVAPEATSSKKPDWAGLTIAVLGFLTALPVLALTIAGFVEEARAHGGVGMHDNRCVLRIGPYLMFFTGYQPQNSRDEFCDDIPSTGQAVVVLDMQNPELRDMLTEIRIIKDLGTHTQINGFPVLTDAELASPDVLDPVTIVYVPPKKYPGGTLNFEHTFPEAAKFIGIVTVKNDHGQTYMSQFSFSVGHSTRLPALSAQGPGCLGRWENLARQSDFLEVRRNEQFFMITSSDGRTMVGAPNDLGQILVSTAYRNITMTCIKGEMFLGEFKFIRISN